MQKRSKVKAVSHELATPDAPVERQDVTTLVEGILDVLERAEADPNDGALSLLTAFMQAADRVLELSTPEETEPNREALVSMIEHARRFIEGWPDRTPRAWSVH